MAAFMQVQRQPKVWNAGDVAMLITDSYTDLIGKCGMDGPTFSDGYCRNLWRSTFCQATDETFFKLHL
jgi:hypothetical protein